ncbi:allantoinase [Thermorudis peleae]|uniref:allantoinase n=1 Tax=Thermorudis peleae TaxID=1382356 RepID=UPI0005702540|nr:allantoinase [Thermorudis peleae]
MAYDVLIRGGQVVQPEGIAVADIAIADGQIVAVEPEISGAVREEIDARGLVVFPGVIDIHVHFNEPGRTTWEGLRTGSRAFAAGGGTLFADMPLNSIPPVLDGAAFHVKQQAAEAQSVVDFALWGGLTPRNLDRLEELAEVGVIGLKAFLADSGVEEFPAADDYTLYEGMRRAAQLQLLVAVHAENATLVRRLAEAALREGHHSARAYLRSRPIIAELEAIQRALLFAEETGCALHIVHVTVARGVLLAWEARQRGVDVSIETCPHYLLFTEDDLERLGPVLKCAPPIRSAAEQRALWQALLRGQIDLIASDHSPSPPELKQSTDFFAAWGGINGVQFTLPAMVTAGVLEHGLPLTQLARLLAARPAERFRFAGRGQLRPGNLADLTLLVVGEPWCPRPAESFSRYPLSPYLGRQFQARVQRTIVRGQTVYVDGRIVREGGGQLVRPQRHG